MSIKIENIQTMGWEGALRGMRNPLNSWDKADSAYASDIERTDTNIAAYGTKLSRYDFIIGRAKAHCSSALTAYVKPRVQAL